MIKRFIDKDATFEFVSREPRIPNGAIPFTLPNAEINPVEGVRTTFDALLEKYRVRDPTVTGIGDIIRDYEFNEETPDKIR